MLETTDAVMVLAEISVGELIDKITILEIKESRITEPKKLVNIKSELEKLRNTFTNTIPMSDKVTKIAADLKSVNAALWDIENAIRDCERKRDFGASFISLARSVYFKNDERAALKAKLNELLGSQIVEEKSYQKY